jgi:threonine/homoserine/homoserine lactone efflux protein
VLLLVKGLIIGVAIAAPREKSAGNSDKSSWHALCTTYFLTLTNPATILSYIAVFAGLGLGAMNPSYLDATILVFGVTLGSGIWWFLG